LGRQNQTNNMHKAVQDGPTVGAFAHHF
jgi:hypothetical protein